VAAIRLIHVDSNQCTSRIYAGVNSGLRIGKIERSERAVALDEAAAKSAFGTALLVFDLACKKGAGHAAQHVIADNVAPRIDAEGACHGRSRVMDRGVGLSGFDKTA
jgi:hypothetical protein